ARARRSLRRPRDRVRRAASTRGHALRSGRVPGSRRLGRARVRDGGRARRHAGTHGGLAPSRGLHRLLAHDRPGALHSMSRRARAQALRATLGAALLCACAGPAAVPERAALAPGRFAPLVPDEADEAAADLAASALVGDADGAYDAQIRIEHYDAEQEESG